MRAKRSMAFLPEQATGMARIIHEPPLPPPTRAPWGAMLA
jgi:hypothetical protein